MCLLEACTLLRDVTYAWARGLVVAVLPGIARPASWPCCHLALPPARGLLPCFFCRASSPSQRLRPTSPSRHHIIPLTPLFTTRLPPSHPPYTYPTPPPFSLHVADGRTYPGRRGVVVAVLPGIAATIVVLHPLLPTRLTLSLLPSLLAAPLRCAVVPFRPHSAPRPTSLSRPYITLLPRFYHPATPPPHPLTLPSSALLLMTSHAYLFLYQYLYQYISRYRDRIVQVGRTICMYLPTYLYLPTYSKSDWEYGVLCRIE